MEGGGLEARVDEGFGLEVSALMKIVTVLGVMAVFAGAGLWAEGVESWPRFRGPDGTGVSLSKQVPVRLNDKTRAWTTALPGPGSSSPVIWGERLFATGEDWERGEVVLVCLSVKDGKKLWSKAVETGSYSTHRMNNTAAATPSLGADLVVFSWYDGKRKVLMLSALTHDGRDIWTCEVGRFRGAHGPNLHTEIHGERLLVAHLHQGGGYVAALNTKTGQPIWKKEYQGSKVSYITPLVRARGNGKKEVVVAGTSVGVRGLDLETGEETWALPDEFDQRTIVSPIDILVGGGTEESLLAVGCKNGVFFAVRPPGRDGGEAKVEWRLGKNAPYVPTPVSDGKMLYVLSDGGVLTAVEAATGRPRWQEKLLANFYASPLLIGGRLYCLSREGEIYVAEVGERFELLATSSLNPGEEVTWSDATPAVAHNCLYVRVGARIDCYRTP